MLPDWLDRELREGSWQRSLIEELNSFFLPDEAKQIWEKNCPGSQLPAWMKKMSKDDYRKSWIHSFFQGADGELVESWLKNGALAEDPLWLTDLLQKQNNDVARVFILSGNVNDYGFSPQRGYMPIRDLLRDSILGQGRVVFHYNLSNHFGNPKYLEDANDQPTKDLLTYLQQLQKTGPQGQQQGIWERVQQDFQFINDLFTTGYNEGICIIIDHAEMLFPPEARELERNVLVEFLLNWAVAPRMFGSKNQIILLSEVVNDISNNLKSQSNKVEIINIDRPQSKEQRLKFLASIKAQESQGVVNQDHLRIKINFVFPYIPITGQGGFVEHALSQGLENAADKSSGLNYLGLEDLLLQTRNNEGELSIQNITQVKGEILQAESAGLLELVETNKTFDDVGGFEMIKERLTGISEAMLNKSSSPLIIRTIPMGVLFLGPPGTGKTLIAKAFAKMCNTNFVKLGDFRSMWVGQSERNLSKALELIRSLSPVIVFMDEIDQSEGSRGESGDSGVGKRVFSKLLQFMSDTSLRGKVLWIAASNRPDLIDAALKRAGRFDMTIPFFLPGPEARQKIFEIHLKNDAIDYSNITTEVWEDLVQRTRGFTGAEIEVLVNEAIRRAITGIKSINGKIHLEGKFLQEVLQHYAPTMNRNMYFKMMALALQDITFTNTLPKEYQGIRLKLIENPELLNDRYLHQLANLFTDIK
ncbi:MAG: ATP-binding protein [Bacteroidota bacterium]